MIRINLLPYRAARKKENIRRQVSIFCLVITLSIVCLAYYTNTVDKKIDRLKHRIADLNNEIKLYKIKADKVTAMEKKLANLKEKTKVLHSLESQRRSSLILLESMTRLVVKNRMWISNLSEKDNQITIKGFAYDNKTVADFMNNLELSPVFAGIDLKSLQMKKINEDINMKSFDIICQKIKNKPEETNQSMKQK